MRKNLLLTAWKWVIIMLQLFFLIIPVIFTFLAYQAQDNDLSIATLEISGLSFLPEDKGILDKSESVSITFKQDSTVSPKILVSATEIRLEDGIAYLRTSLIALVIFSGILAIFGLEQLKRMIKTVESGTPFIRTNVWRIYILSALFFLVPLIGKFCYYLQQRWFVSNFEFSGMILEDNSVNFFSWFLAGILLLTIGKILEQGIKIQEEQDLTV
jgi:hypothetical protein